jgi:hypothetical protein
MSAYSTALFLHVVGALGFFLALGLEWMGLHRAGGELDNRVSEC